MQRDVRSRDKRDVITIRHFVALYVSQSVQRFKNGLRKRKITMNKNSLALSA